MPLEQIQLETDEQQKPSPEQILTQEERFDNLNNYLEKIGVLDPSLQEEIIPVLTPQIQNFIEKYANFDTDDESGLDTIEFQNFIRGLEERIESIIKLNELEKYFGVSEGNLVNLEVQMQDELGFQLSGTLEKYQTFLEAELAYPSDPRLAQFGSDESSQNTFLTREDHQKMITNIKSILMTKVSGIPQMIAELKENNGGTLENMQWIANEEIQNRLSDISTTLLPSAKFYILMHSQSKYSDDIREYEKNLPERSKPYFKSHIIGRMMDIKSGLIDTQNPSEIPSGILSNDSFFTLNKEEKNKNDRALLESFGESPLKEVAKDTEMASFLNEKDQETQEKAMYFYLAACFAQMLPYAGTPLSIPVDAEDAAGLFGLHNHDATLAYLQRAGLVDQDFRMKSTWIDNAFGAVGLAATLFGMQGASKIYKAEKAIALLKKSKGFDENKLAMAYRALVGDDKAIQELSSGVVNLPDGGKMSSGVAPDSVLKANSELSPEARIAEANNLMKSLNPERQLTREQEKLLLFVHEKLPSNPGATRENVVKKRFLEGGFRAEDKVLLRENGFTDAEIENLSNNALSENERRILMDNGIVGLFDWGKSTIAKITGGSVEIGNPQKFSTMKNIRSLDDVEDIPELIRYIHTNLPNGITGSQKHYPPDELIALVKTAGNPNFNIKRVTSKGRLRNKIIAIAGNAQTLARKYEKQVSEFQKSVANISPGDILVSQFKENGVPTEFHIIAMNKNSGKYILQYTQDGEEVKIQMSTDEILSQKENAIFNLRENYVEVRKGKRPSINSRKIETQGDGVRVNRYEYHEAKGELLIHGNPNLKVDNLESVDLGPNNGSMIIGSAKGTGRYPNNQDRAYMKVGDGKSDFIVRAGVVDGMGGEGTAQDSEKISNAFAEGQENSKTNLKTAVTNAIDNAKKVSKGKGNAVFDTFSIRKLPNGQKMLDVAHVGDSATIVIHPTKGIVFFTRPQDLVYYTIAYEVAQGKRNNIPNGIMTQKDVARYEGIEEEILSKANRNGPMVGVQSENPLQTFPDSLQGDISLESGSVVLSLSDWYTKQRKISDLPNLLSGARTSEEVGQKLAELANSGARDNVSFVAYVVP